MMARLYAPDSIVEETNAHRVFYFHEFCYFVDTLDYRNNLTHDILKSYFVQLLLVFDEILIPLEHITISYSSEEAAFKSRFLNSLLVRELISEGRLVTTRWTPCSDTSDHIEACDKYMHSIGAGSSHFAQSARTAVLEMRVFGRDQGSQSLRTRDYAEATLGEKDRDLLRYEDGPVVIEFSVENAILGNARDKLTRPDARDVAERAYVRAMTIGNGNIFRAAVDRSESVTYSQTTLFDPLVPLTESQGINPVLLKSDFLWRLLRHVGYQVPRLGCNTWVWDDRRWVGGFLEYLTRPGVAKMKDILIRMLEHISAYDIKSYEDFREALGTIVVKPFDAFLSRLILLILRRKDYAVDKFEELAEGRQPAHELVLDTFARDLFNRSLKEGWSV